MQTEIIVHWILVTIQIFVVNPVIFIVKVNIHPLPSLEIADLAGMIGKESLGNFSFLLVVLNLSTS